MDNLQRFWVCFMWKSVAKTFYIGYWRSYDSSKTKNDIKAKQPLLHPPKTIPTTIAAVHIWQGISKSLKTFPAKDITPPLVHISSTKFEQDLKRYLLPKENKPENDDRAVTEVSGRISFRENVPCYNCSMSKTGMVSMFGTDRPHSGLA